jgi:hypothetical protein
VRFRGSVASYRGQLWGVAQTTADLLQAYWRDENNDWPGDCGSCDATDQSIADMKAIQNQELPALRQMQAITGRFGVMSSGPAVFWRPVSKLTYALHHLDDAVVATGNGGYGDGDEDATKAEKSLAGAWRALKALH